MSESGLTLSGEEGTIGSGVEVDWGEVVAGILSS